MIDSPITASIVSDPYYEHLVVELEQAGDAIGTVTMEKDTVLVEFKHDLTRSAKRSLVPMDALLEALRRADAELRGAYEGKRALPEQERR